MQFIHINSFALFFLYYRFYSKILRHLLYQTYGFLFLTFCFFYDSSINSAVKKVQSSTSCPKPIKNQLEFLTVNV